MHRIEIIAVKLISLNPFDCEIKYNTWEKALPYYEIITLNVTIIINTELESLV